MLDREAGSVRGRGFGIENISEGMMATRVLKVLRTEAEGPGGDPRAAVICLTLRHLVTALYSDHYPKGGKPREQWLSEVLEAFASAGDGLQVVDQLARHLLTGHLPQLVQDADILGLLEQVAALIGERAQSDPGVWDMRQSALGSALETSRDSHRDRSLDNSMTLEGLLQDVDLGTIDSARMALDSSDNPECARLMVLYAVATTRSATMAAVRKAEPGAPFNVLKIKGRRAENEFYVALCDKVLELLGAQE